LPEGKRKPKAKRKSARKIDPLKGMSAGERSAQKNIQFIGGDPTGKNEKKVRETLRDSFTQSELRKMGRVDVSFGKIPYDNRAVYYGKYDNRTDITEIVYNPKVVEADDITHEFIHVLKENDTSRKGYAAAGNTKQKRLNASNRTDVRNIEESTVVAEAAIRTNKPAKQPSGYYRDIPETKGNQSKMKKLYNEDRKILLDEPTTPLWKTKGVQGKAAVAKVNKNFIKTNISKKKVKGRTAIRSYQIIKK